MQRDKQFKVEGNWALATDGLQWVLQRKNGNAWEGASFVHTTKEILARCVRERGIEPLIAEKLLNGLPDSFEEWKTAMAGLPG